MKAAPNEYGVFLDYEVEVFFSDSKDRALARLAHTEDGWRYGYDLRLGGVSVGCGGMSSVPSMRDAPFPTRGEALEACRMWLLKFAEGMAIRSKADPVLSARIEAIISALKQPSLF